MNFNDYQTEAKKTAQYPPELAVAYLALGIAGEAGEVANKVKKIIRDDQSVITDEKRQAILDEVGDTLWYAAMLCEELGVSLADVAQANIAKLTARQAAGTIKGSGEGVNR